MRGRLRVTKVNGRFPAKHAKDVDPELVGLRAFDHPAVKAWHKWLLEEYRPRYSVALVTPCSNVKPYPLSPTSRKIRGVLRRLGLWDGAAPRSIEWLYLSDLLILVPYERAWDYPACCYELHPDEVLHNGVHYNLVASLLSRLIESKLAGRQVILFLPAKHLQIWEDAKRRASKWPMEHRVKYSIFSVKPLEETLARVAPKPSTSTLDRWLR